MFTWYPSGKENIGQIEEEIRCENACGQAVDLQVSVPKRTRDTRPSVTPLSSWGMKVLVAMITGEQLTAPDVIFSVQRPRSQLRLLMEDLEKRGR